MDWTDDLLRAADAADMERFPLIHPAELELWCSYPAWTIDEAVALSINRDPHVISPQIIKRLGLILHPHGVSPKDWKRLSRIAGLYEARHIHLLRAARHDLELQATPVDGGFEIRPLDFLAWEKPRRGQGPWSGISDVLVERVKAFHTGKTDAGKEEALSSSVSEPATAAEPDTEKEKTGLSSSGVSADAPVCLSLEDQCRDYLIAEMRKSPERAPKTKEKYKEECKRLFKGLGTRAFKRAWDAAIEATGSSWGGAGRRSNKQ